MWDWQMRGSAAGVEAVYDANATARIGFASILCHYIISEHSLRPEDFTCQAITKG